MKKTYLIDSENVNDIWVELLGAAGDEDEILVFYTDKSAHMGYDRIVRLMEYKSGTIQWIRCFGGQNALDFQLVTELGYRISQEPDREYTVVSDDTGYDVVVRYWKKRACSVDRIRGVECERMAARCRKEAQQREEVEQREEVQQREVEQQGADELAAETDTVELNTAPESETGIKGSTAWDEQLTYIFQECGSHDPEKDMLFLQSLCKTIRVSNMSQMHNILECQFGQRAGKGIYRFLKENPGCRGYLATGYSNSKKQREKEYLRLVLNRNGINGADIDLVWKIVTALPRKNLNVIHTTLVKKFGQEKGGDIYAAVRSHVKIIRGL